VERALADPATRKRLEEIGAVIPQRLGPEALRTLVAAEVPKWTRVLRAAGVTGQ
jgi:tripartite-type tricarboxylate transporter receptor subunit TctC